MAAKPLRRATTRKKKARAKVRGKKKFRLEKLGDPSGPDPWTADKDRRRRVDYRDERRPGSS